MFGHAARGRRARRLEPDPETVSIVKWIFAQRLAGHSIARIARVLDDTGIPCLSAADPERNAYPSGRAWTATTVRTILAYPRYTGWQVWNRQPTAPDLSDPANTGLGHRQVQRWNLPACEFLPALAVLHARLDTEFHQADEPAALHALEAETSAALATGSWPAGPDLAALTRAIREIQAEECAVVRSSATGSTPRTWAG
jgi:hypothetical protein